MPYSLVSLSVSEADFDNFKQQVQDVINYLKANYQARTCKEPGGNRIRNIKIRSRI